MNDKMTEPELKPCPMCGKPFTIIAANGGWMYNHNSIDCPFTLWGETGSNWMDRVELVNALNARPIEDQLRAELEQAKAENERLNAECDGQLDKIASRDTKAMELRNENARLRAALRKIGNAYISEYINGEWIPSAVRNIDDAITVARAALAGCEG